jgi:ketosteroid isomerase-like protein
MQTKTMILSTILSVGLTAPCFAKPANAPLGNAQSVEQANARFYEGLNAMFAGDASPMEEIWSHSDDVTYMGPAGGFQLGWEQVLAAWEAQAALKLGGEIVADELRVIAGRDLAIVHCRESGNNLDAQGRPLQVSIRATNVFRKENGAWKMVGHHTDLLPFLEKEPRATPAK